MKISLARIIIILVFVAVAIFVLLKLPVAGDKVPGKFILSRQGFSSKQDQKIGSEFVQYQSDKSVEELYNILLGKLKRWQVVFNKQSEREDGGIKYREAIIFVTKKSGSVNIYISRAEGSDLTTVEVTFFPPPK